MDGSGTLGYQNLTQNLADNIAQKFIQSNLSGPSTTGNTQGINVPGDIQSVVSQYLDSSSIDASKIPSAKIDENKLNIIKNPSKEDVLKYFASLQTIMSGFEGQEFKNLNSKAKSGRGEELLGSFVLFYSDIETKLYDLKIPEPELQFHKDLILLMDIPAVIFSQNLDSDPLMASVVLSNSQTLLENTKLNLLKELEMMKVTVHLPLKTTGFWANLLGVKTTHAQFAVFDPINWIENFLDEIFNTLDYYLNYDSWYGVILTEQLKDKILKAVVNAILNWANGGSGGSSPTFVTNWGEFLKNSYVNAADAAIADVTSGVCEPFRSQIQLQLYSLYGESSVKNVARGPTINDLRTCSLQQTVSNLDDFYGDFGQGGWAGYLALTDFGGNPYGSLYAASQQVGQAAERAEDASKAKASSGYKGTERCANGESPISEGVCADKSTPEVTTPGTNIAQSTSDSLTSAIHRVVNANDWKGLAAQLALFAITKITAGGNKGIRYSDATGQKPADKYASCSGYPVGSSDYLACVKGIDEANSSGGGHGTQSLLLSQTKQALTDADATLEAVKLSLDAASTSIEILQSVASNSSQCPSEAVTAQGELDGLNQQYADLLTKYNSLTSQISALTDFRSEVENHDSQDEDFFLAKLDEFNNVFGGPGAFARARGEAQAQAQDLQNKLQQSSDLLKACLAH